MQRIIALSLSLLLLASCASQLTQRVTLVPAPLECQVTEVRTSVLATSILKLCWDETGKFILATASEGESIAGTAAKAGTILGVVGAGIAVGSGLSKGTSVNLGE